MSARSSTFKFTERLARDDEFRARVVLQPEAALAEYGLASGPGVIPDRVELPAREEVLRMVGIGPEDPQPEPEPEPEPWRKPEPGREPEPRPPKPEPPLPRPEPDVIGPSQNLGLMLATR